ncbi:MAG: leucyl/phenylalanyl-tRNA--protein transferase [Calditrichaeota bacterium]|nr:MAG: leucyl/phenylalanyl-tRNA--protein transferase [Calditrichota bacterium]
MITAFPPVERADPETGLLAVGGDLEVESLLLAYRSGIFPWPIPGQPVLWFAPARRAILEFSELHIPKRLARTLRRAPFRFAVDRDFEQVIRRCAANPNRKRSSGTWITDEMISAYVRFHEAGFAHSFETYDEQDRLVGGLYGVWLGKFFAGESMFFLRTDASKFALIQAVAHLRAHGLTWMDVQVLSPFLKRFGAREVERAVFMQKLQRALRSV